MNTSEVQDYCLFNQTITVPPVTNQPFHFTANYQLRTYTACCYYLDQNSMWQTKGLIVSLFFHLLSSQLFIQVGPLTNHYQTQCFSNHLTTFAGGFLVLPAPINWNYVFANADFARNRTIYLTVIIITVLYILFMIYARYQDRKDIEKVRNLSFIPHFTREFSWELHHCRITMHWMNIFIKFWSSPGIESRLEPDLR